MNELIRSITCVNVIAEFTADGVLIPKAIRWKNGTVYDIDKIIFTNKCVGVMSSKIAQRFKVAIGGEERYLFYEANGQWFIENKRHTIEEGC